MVSHLFLGQQLPEVLQLYIRALFQVQQLEACQTLGYQGQEVSLKPDHTAKLEVDQELAAGHDVEDPDIGDLPAPIQLEDPEVGALLGYAHHALVIQLGALGQVQVDQVVELAVFEGGYEAVRLQLSPSSYLEPLEF